MEKTLELINPDNLTYSRLICEIEKHSQELRKLLKHISLNLRNAPEGRLRSGKNKKSIQYFQVTENSPKNGFYLSKDKLKLARNLAQKDYYTLLKKASEHDLEKMNKAGKLIASCKLFSAHTVFPENKRILITPITLSNAEYGKIWQSIEYSGNNYHIEQKKFLTARHELVRSKSEVLIADALARFGVPYKYEYPIELTREDGRKFTFYPDFCCLNLRTRQEYFWEHLGIMDKPDYAKKNVKKLNDYFENEYFPGEKLLFTMETATSPQNNRLIELIIRKYLL